MSYGGTLEHALADGGRGGRWQSAEVEVGHVDGKQSAAEHGAAERRAGVLERLEHGRARPGPLLVQLGDGRGCRRGHGEAGAHSGDGQPQR